MSSAVRAVLNRLQRNLRKYEREWRAAQDHRCAAGLDIAVSEVRSELRKLDRPKRSATTRAARKSR